jgi:hypothetical protein
MEDGIERMMTPDLYNIHYIYENKNKIAVKESIVKTHITTKNENELNLKDIKELKSTNPQ